MVHESVVVLHEAPPGDAIAVAWRPVGVVTPGNAQVTVILPFPGAVATICGVGTLAAAAGGSPEKRAAVIERPHTAAIHPARVRLKPSIADASMVLLARFARRVTN